MQDNQHSQESTSKAAHAQPASDGEETSAASEFEKASHEVNEGFLREFAAFLFENKKWWMTPIFLVLGLLALLVVFSSSAAAPFIYSLF